MALNTVQVVSPRRDSGSEEREKHDPWEDIMKGLTIANQAFGIAVDYQRFQKIREDRAAADLTRADERAGVFSQRDRTEMAKGFREVPEGTEGALPFKHRQGDEVKTSFMLKREPAISAPVKTRQVKTVDDQGNPVVKIVEDKPGLTLPAFQEPKANAPTRAEISQQEHFEKAVERVGKTLAPSKSLFTSIDAIEKQLGFKLEDYDQKTNMAGGKEVDAPGVSIPLVGRVTAFDSDARTLESRVANVFNIELKDRSGAAVTTPEMERLKTEFGAGKFNTEAELIGALKQYKKAASEALRNTEAAFRPEAVAEFEKRGGFTSADLNKKAASPGDIVKVGDKTYKVADDGDTLIEVGASAQAQ